MSVSEPILSKAMASDWPPYPTVLMSRGQWVKVIDQLITRDSAVSRELASKIRQQIDKNAKRINAGQNK